jgi:hypothetical protein
VTTNRTRRDQEDTEGSGPRQRSTPRGSSCRPTTSGSTRLVVAAAIVEAAEKLDLSYPEIDTAKQKELEVARAARSRARSSHTDGVRSRSGLHCGYGTSQGAGGTNDELFRLHDEEKYQSGIPGRSSHVSPRTRSLWPASLSEAFMK